MNRRTTPDKEPSPAQEERRERQAEALRENLKRRKAQQRARADNAEESNDG
jgi:hypothetical protein